MNTPEPYISFCDLLAYSDYLAQRWLRYFQQNPAAFDVNVGGRTPTLRDLITHIFQVEQFFADLLLQEDAKPTGRPAQMDPLQLDDMQRLHQQTHEKLTLYIGSADEERLARMRTLGPRTVSNRKVLAQAVLHSVHHWAQVAMEVRQAGFPTEMPQDIIASPVMQ